MNLSWQNTKLHAQFHSFFSRKRVKSEMLSLFLRIEKWILFSFHSFREWKVKWKCLEIENEKWNENASRSRSRSEMSTKFSRNETLAGYWKVVTKRNKNWKEFLSPELVIFSSLKNSPISSNHQNFHQNWWQKNTKLGSIIVTRIGEIFVT